MSATSGRIRAELQAQTGADFRRYADDDLIDAVSGWSGLVGLAKDFGISLALGIGLALVAGAVALTTELDAEAQVGVIIGGIVAGLGAMIAFFALRARKRAPSEAAKVFELTGAMVDRVAEDVATGRITVTASQAARGLALVAAAPALTRIAQRRFPLVGTLAAPAVGALLTRVLARVWPAGGAGGQPLVGLEGTARRLNEAVGDAETAVIPKLARAVRWVTVPILVAGLVILAIGCLTALLSIVTA
jgi:hypothetical protein